MGFSDLFDSPTSSTSNSSGWGDLFASASPDQVTRQQNIQQSTVAAQTASQNADYAASIPGLAKNTFFDLGTKLKNAGMSFVNSLWQTYQQTPQKLAEDVQAGASDMQTGGTPYQQAAGLLKGVAKSGGRTAADVGIAVFAPISAAVGSLLQLTGGQTLTDNAGKVIADTSGITDLPAFQKFATDHPNAGEDFNRLLTLFMANAEKGKINTPQIIQDAKTVALKLITGKGPETQAPKPFASVFQTPTETPQTPPVAAQSTNVPESSPIKTGISPVARTIPETPSKVVSPESQPVQVAQPTDVFAQSPKIAETPVESPPGNTTTKVASDINSHLAKQGIDALPPELQAKYTQGSYKNSESRVAQMLTDNLDQVKEMAKTGENIPHDVHPQILFNSVIALAKDTKDYPLLQDLAKSPLASARSEHAAGLGSAGYNHVQFDPVEALRRANEAKSGGTKGKATTQANVKEAKATIKKSTVKIMDYNAIIDAVTTC